MTNSAHKTQESAGKISVGRLAVRVLCIILVTVLLLAGTVYGVMYIVIKGPSPTARNLLVLSLRETSAVGFLANVYLSDEQIAQIEATRFSGSTENTDASLVTVRQENDTHGNMTDDYGFTDEDGDGIVIDKVHGEGYNGFMMIVKDPSRVVLGCVPEKFGRQSFTVEQMVQEFGAVAGINAGGFYDPGGQGDGSMPDSLVVYDGVVYCEERGINHGFVGFDSNNILHVGNLSADEIRESDVQYGVCFGPVLIVNGEAVEGEGMPIASGINPRTAIGQRADGAVLMLVIDGRQVVSLGATYADVTQVMLDYGAVNACNLDGGSSALMWFDGGYINNCASVVGIRPVPTTFLVLPKEGETDE